MQPLILGAGLAIFIADWSLRYLVQTQAYDIIILVLVFGWGFREAMTKKLRRRTQWIISVAVAYKILILFYYALSHDVAAYLIGFISAFILASLGILFVTNETRKDLQRVFGSAPINRMKGSDIEQMM